MGQVVTLASPVDKLVLEIRAHVHDAGRAESTCAKHQLQAGLRLIELRASVERDGGDWWTFFDDKFTGYIKSRKHAEQLMKWARADDPEGAMDADRASQREAMRALREGRKARAESGCNVTSIQDQNEDLVGKALRIVERMSADERERFNAAYQEKYL